MNQSMINSLMSKIEVNWYLLNCPVLLLQKTYFIDLATMHFSVQLLNVLHHVLWVLKASLWLISSISTQKVFHFFVSDVDLHTEADIQTQYLTASFFFHSSKLASCYTKQMTKI